MLFLDFKKRKQHFFNPDRDPKLAAAFATRSSRGGARLNGKLLCSFLSFFNGAVAATEADDGWAANHHSIQYKFDTHRIGRALGMAGQCGILTILVLICCMRFGYWHPTNMARAICGAVPSNAARRTLVAHLVGWYDALTLAQPNQIRAMIFPNLANRGRCNVYSQATGRLCSRMRCAGAGHCFCWQHRWILENPFSAGPGGKRCAAALVAQPASVYS
jgi:hypothetical protein